MVKDGNRLVNKKYWGTKSLTNEKAKAKGSLIPQEENRNPYLSFSFRYFTQQEYFGIGEQDAAWFTNLLEVFLSLDIGLNHKNLYICNCFV